VVQGLAAGEETIFAVHFSSRCVLAFEVGAHEDVRLDDMSDYLIYCVVSTFPFVEAVEDHNSVALVTVADEHPVVAVDVVRDIEDAGVEELWVSVEDLLVRAWLKVVSAECGNLAGDWKIVSKGNVIVD